MKKLVSISVLFLFVFLVPSFIIKAQTDLSEGWEVHEAEHQPPKKIMDAIGVKPGMIIGEVGAGRGRFTVYLAREVGPKGKIYANDISKNDLQYLADRCKKNGFKNVEIILGNENQTLLPNNALDLSFMVYVYHHLSKPDEILKDIKKSLKPNATLAVVEMRDFELDRELHVDRSKPNPAYPPIKERIEKSAKNAGYEVVRIETFLKNDLIYILRPIK